MKRNNSGKIILVTGGVRSGKSQYVVATVKKTRLPVWFIATAIPSDKEIKLRIMLHQNNRPKNWIIIEEPRNLIAAINQIPRCKNIVIIDCLNFWLANRLRENERQISEEIKYVCKLLTEKFYITYLVTNEVGLSLIPINSVGRKFQDLLGIINSIVAEYAQEVIFMIAGIPVKIKS